jgi:myosin heavy subunit
MKEHRDRIRRENVAATKLQARWRAYHVRRVRLDAAAVRIQRCARGYIVRKEMKRQHAAAVIQKHAKGMLVRKQLSELSKAATALQRVARGKQARQECKVHQQNLLKATMVIQRSMRRWKARKLAMERRSERDAREARVKAAIVIQSVVRGRKGRVKAEKRKREYLAEVEERRAAIRIQSLVRRKQAEKHVDNLRRVRLQGMNQAATIIRKHWLRSIHRRRYLELRQDFLLHVGSIVTIQRYVRGFLVRLRMWRNAIRAEEELWAAVEIQRVWRGYMGRLRWELAYEAVWSREVAALRLQRYIRGWLARTRVHRMRRKLARAEFEKARRRFKAAQMIQANARGWIVRRRTEAYRKRIVKEVTTIQKCVRGHQLRSKLWKQVMEKRVVKMQSFARGFIVRNRRFHFIANVIFIQRHYRMWLKKVSAAERRKRVEGRRAQRLAAKVAS